jgi:ABC-type Fe3+/spermidine/putrescine transport system ATPase subunit
MATRIAIMSGGKVLQQGTPREIYDRPANRFVANFIGDANFLDGAVVSGATGRQLRLADGFLVDVPGDAAEGRASLMVRPEFLKLRSSNAVGASGAAASANAVGGGAGAGSPGIPGRVVNVAFLGNHTRITVATAVAEMVVVRPHGTRESSSDTPGAVGEEVCIWWQAEDTALIRD